MSTTSMEDVFKSGFMAGRYDEDEADEAYEKYRYNQLLKASGKEAADEWLKARHQPKSSTIENLKCPDCNGQMLPRSSQYGKFWGCAAYPRCKGTRDSEGLSKEERKNEKEMIKGPFLDPVDNREDVPVESGELYKFKKG